MYSEICAVSDEPNTVLPWVTLMVSVSLDVNTPVPPMPVLPVLVMTVPGVVTLAAVSCPTGIESPVTAVLVTVSESAAVALAVAVPVLDATANISTIVPANPNGSAA